MTSDTRRFLCLKLIPNRCRENHPSRRQPTSRRAVWKRYRSPTRCSQRNANRRASSYVCDGTGNEFAAKDSLDGNSNVVKLYTALRLDNQQVAYYHPGVGTLGDPSKKGLARKWSVVTGLAFGSGFEDNVLDAYRYLMQHYADGDRVYIFGFSRGAYTARALAGLLHGYGLLCRGNEGHIPYAWRMYTQKIETQKELNAHTISTDTTFRDTFSHKNFSIHFIGLWDTVSSVGWITTPLRLLDVAENPIIQRGRHAVSIDERRCFFRDNLYGKPVAVDIPVGLRGTPEGDAIPKIQDVLQVWFSGVHSDVGGSYPQLQSGLSNITLEWMIKETEDAGAHFDKERERMVLGTPGPGEPTPATAALASMYEKPKSHMLHRSLHTIWWLLELFPHRYYDKDDASVKKRISLGAYRKIPTGSLVHTSVRERLAAQACYRPRNIASEDLMDPPSSHDAYLRFEPKKCREYSMRKNPFVVFVVAALEFGFALYALSWLIALAHWHVPVREILTSVWKSRSAMKGFVVSHWLSKMGQAAVFVWIMFISAAVVLIGEIDYVCADPGVAMPQASRLRHPSALSSILVLIFLYFSPDTRCLAVQTCLLSGDIASHNRPEKLTSVMTGPHEYGVTAEQFFIPGKQRRSEVPAFSLSHAKGSNRAMPVATPPDDTDRADSALRPRTA
ncbi:uncharacterized protein (DUF2235 family) [Edaphobacter aggregans]|uniref:Uncharacterized protein (DUF2235 family) n=1 Tax=Edaphobacter aggregans TaxID=570835 RepID=A0A428MLA5_9BACT|nr:DUF2235 domain-containing protein [Edaphobacter aggregans]RSL17698.1 uncharacterized protein (DUF2235 family) [Edaphobacter aggregans]